MQANWKTNAKDRHDALLAEYNAMQPWQRNNAKDFYGTNLQYLKELMANPVPHLEVSWCTRFNAFVPKDDPFNYAMPGTPIPNVTYPTDNEVLCQPTLPGHLYHFPESSILPPHFSWAC